MRKCLAPSFKQGKKQKKPTPIARVSLTFDSAFAAGGACKGRITSLSCMQRGQAPRAFPRLATASESRLTSIARTSSTTTIPPPPGPLAPPPPARYSPRFLEDSTHLTLGSGQQALVCLHVRACRSSARSASTPRKSIPESAGVDAEADRSNVTDLRIPVLALPDPQLLLWVSPRAMG